MYVTVAKKHLKDCGSDQISLTSENANLKNYVLMAIHMMIGSVQKSFSERLASPK